MPRSSITKYLGIFQNEIIMLKRHLNSHDYCSIIHYSQEMETTYVHHWGTDMQNFMQTHNEVLFGDKREQNLVLCGRDATGGYIKCSFLAKGQDQYVSLICTMW